MSLLYQEPSVPNENIFGDEPGTNVHSFLICRKLYLHINFGGFLIFQTAFLLAMGVLWNIIIGLENIFQYYRYKTKAQSGKTGLQNLIQHSFLHMKSLWSVGTEATEAHFFAQKSS